VYATPDYRDPAQRRGLVFRLVPGNIWVNQQGRRFHNESMSGGNSASPALMAQSPRHAWAIMDTPMTATMEVADPYYRDGDKVVRAKVVELLDNSPFIRKADTLAELAARMEVARPRLLCIATILMYPMLLDACRQGWFQMRSRQMGSMRLTRPFGRIAVLAAFAGLAAAQPAAAQEVKLNEVLRSLFYAPQYVALRSGAFEQEGLKIAGPKTTWGVQAAVTEVVSGNSNIALMGPEAAGLTQDASPDRRLVNFALLTNGDGGFILSKTAMPNFTIADLKGKTIVTSGKGSTPALVLVDLIKKAGLDPNKDVTIRNIPVSANIIPSYLEPSTNFAQAFEPMVVQAVAENRGYRVASVGALAGPMPYTAFMAPASYIEKNPAIVQAFTNAVYKGLIWTDTHSPAEIAALIAPDFKDVPVATVEAVIAEYKKVKIWAPDPLLRPEGMDQMMGLMVDAGVLKQRFPYDQIVNPSFAQKAIQTIKR